ncbi:sarcosine dehydrogenase, mitochondrial isoform X3 [Pteropus alecto]|uniref:sarcosine dehydrogenase, mitochondrial isoform X3 n=1 Tax=Pteropus alecto TaxID=9402 RepID=UPI000D533D24|nr:sarcosine dehydrogenase, mitochondrial isoform X3 [Pteropus alecto]
MASLSRALRVAATRPPRSLARCPGLCPLSSGARPTAEKNVPYQRTLKEERGPSAVAQGPSRPLPSTADVVVIGGGSLGCQTLYHLAKLGVSGALLLERGRLTSGTTWHTAGLLWQLRPSDVEVELLAHTRRVVSHDLPEETGLHTGWVPNGGLFIASSRQRLLEYQRLMSLGKAYGVESHVLSPAETKTLYPLMNVDDLYGTLYVPGDGTIDPAGTCSALARAATARAAQNMPNVRDHDASIYLRLQGDALSVGGYEANPIFWEEVSDKFAFGLFDLDWEVFGQHIEGAINRVPVLEKTGVKSTVCGPESFTPDHKPLMGEAPELRGFFLGCGFNSAGMMLGGGCGQELAHWIVHGRPEKDMYSYDIRRFHCSLTGHRRWIRERSHESYAKNYSIVFPHDEPLAGRSMRTGPLHEELLAQGCVFQERHGWERPGWFTPEGTAPVLPYDYYGAYGNRAHQDHAYGKLLADEHTFDFPPHHDVIKQECLACRGAAAVFDMSYFGKFYLVGLDARKAADWLFSADVSRPPGSTVYTCMLNHRGGTESDLTVSRLAPSPQASPLTPAFEGDGYYLAVGGATAQHNSSYILAVLQDRRFRCQLIDSSEALGLISIQGPASRAILQEVLDADLSNEAFPFSTHKLVTAAGHLVRAMRLSFVGELGWELHIPRLSCVPVYQAVMAAGAKHGLVPAGYRAIDNLSIEKGYRHWHADLRPDDSPLEAGLAFTCKLKSATPFLGREALEKQRAQGLRRRLVCLTVDEKVPVFGLEAIWRDGRVVGHTRRAGFGFAIDKPIAYGYVRDPSGGLVSPDFVKSGDYALERMGVTYPAQAHLKSPFDPDNKRVKGIY